MFHFPDVTRLGPQQGERFSFLPVVAALPLLLLLMALLNHFGHLSTAGLLAGVAVTIACMAILFAVTTGGRRLRDPSLASAQVASAILVIFTAMAFASPAARDLFIAILLIVFLLGISRLPGRQCLVLGLLASLAYALIVLAIAQFRMDGDARLEMLRWVATSLILVCAAVLGDYACNLRQRLAESRAALDHALKRARTLSTQDELTGVCNRRVLHEMLEHERNRSDRTGAPVSVCMLDIDRFKAVNERAGPFVGDRVLRRVAQIAGCELRTGDRLGRLGGDAFLLILPDTPLEGAQARAERLRAGVERWVSAALLPGGRLSVSIGVAQLRDGEAIEECLNRAGEALHRAKKGGRNRVAAAAVEPEGPGGRGGFHESGHAPSRVANAVI